MRRDFVRKASLYLIALPVILAVSASGCTVPPKVELRDTGLLEAMKNLPPAVEVKILIVVMLEGTEESSARAEARLKGELGPVALPWIGTALEEKHVKEVEERLINLMVAILLNDAASVREEIRATAVKQLVNLDRKRAIIDQLLLRIEIADQRLSNSIFDVLEKRLYVSGTWAWPDQAWRELSARFASNENVIKRYITYKLSDLPEFNAKMVKWGDFDAKYALTVLSKLARSEHYADLAPVFAAMLDARAPTIRRHAVTMLGCLGYEAVANKLTEMLVEDPSTRVRSAAAEALGRMKAEEVASTALVVLLRKGDLLGSNVCWALGEMKSQKAVSALIQIADKELPAMVALGKIGNELAIKPLVRVLESSTNLKARICAARALGYFNTNDALQALKMARKDEPSSAAKREMLFSIFKMKPEPNKDAVLRYVADWDVKVRLTAMALLLSKGFRENISITDMILDIEGLPADQRVWFWTTLKNSFEDIPNYSPHGLGYRRDAQITAITKWFNKNKLDFYWDKAAGKFKLK